MKVYARGWRRNMGPNEIGDIDLEKAKLDQAPMLSGSTWTVPGEGVGGVRNNLGVHLNWRKELHLTGAYMVGVELTRRDVAQLFRWIFGDSVSVETLERLGITVTGQDPGRGLAEMKLGDFLELVQSGKREVMGAGPHGESGPK